MDRDKFLGRIRAARQTSGLPASPEDPPGGLIPELPEIGLIERFVERAQAAAGVIHQVANDEEAIQVVTELLGKYDATEYLAWDAEHLPVAGLTDRLPGKVIGAEVPADASNRLGHQAGYMSIRVGITGTSGGLAESGSIVLDCGPGRSRMASLIPLVHIALLRSSDIVPSLSHWVADHPRAALDTANLVVITGPSRTADIEQILNLGVHGPKDVHVVIIASRG